MKHPLFIIRLLLAAVLVIFMASCDFGGCGNDDDGDDDSATAYYALTINVEGNGRTDPAAGTYTYPQGTTVSVTAEASDGATFAGWSGSADGTASTTTVTMTADQILIANFVVTDDGSGDVDTGSTDGGGDDGSNDDDYNLPDHCNGQCNSATPVYPTILEDGGMGNVTMYTTEASNGGACNYGVTEVMYFAAMSVNVVPGDAMGQWQGGAICGQCVEVTAVTTQGPKKVVIRIMDKCPDGDCGIDLGGAAPAEVMVDGFGRYDGSWRFVPCEGHPEVSDGPPTLDVFSGSNMWWSRVHVRNGSGAVDAITWKDTASSANGIFPFATNPENFFEVPQNEVLQSSMTSVLITIHYVDGSTATVTLSPQQLGTSGVSYLLD